MNNEKEQQTFPKCKHDILPFKQVNFQQSGCCFKQSSEVMPLSCLPRRCNEVVQLLHTVIPKLVTIHLLQMNFMMETWRRQAIYTSKWEKNPQNSNLCFWCLINSKHPCILSEGISLQ